MAMTSRVFGQRLMEYEKVPVEDGTTPTHDTPSEVLKVQRQLKVLQYATPAHVAVLMGIRASHG